MSLRGLYCFILLASLTAAGQSQSLSNLSVGSPLPAFSLVDSEGREFSSSALSGKPAMIVYWKSGQAASESLLKDCASWKGEFPDLQILLVCSGDTIPPGMDSGLPRVLLDREKHLYGAWGVRVFPSVVIIDSNGIVLKTDAGYGIGDRERWHDESARLLGLQESPRAVSDMHVLSRSRNSDEAVRLYQTGKRLWDEGFFERAYENWTNSLKMDSGCAPSWIGLAKYFFRNGEIEQAETHLAAAMGIEPSVEALVLKARCRIQQQDLNGARELMNSALDLNRRSVDAKLTLAEVYLLQNNTEEAAALVEEVLSLNKDHPRAWYLRGRIAEARNNLEAAIEGYRRALEILVSRQ